MLETEVIKYTALFQQCEDENRNLEKKAIYSQLNKNYKSLPWKSMILDFVLSYSMAHMAKHFQKNPLRRISLYGFLEIYLIERENHKWVINS